MGTPVALRLDGKLHVDESDGTRWAAGLTADGHVVFRWARPEEGGTRRGEIVWTDPADIPDGFDPWRTARTNSAVVSEVGQSSTTRRLPLWGATLYAHLFTGPPTWWAPRGGVQFGDDGDRIGEVRLGWLRAAAAVSLHRTPGARPSRRGVAVLAAVACAGSLAAAVGRRR